MRNYDLNDPDDRQYLVEQYSASLVYIAASAGERSMNVKISGVQRDGVPYGDWIVSVDRIPSLKLVN